MGNITSDIYFDDNYGKLYEKADKGTAVVFMYQSPLGKIKHQFIKRRIPAELLREGEEYFDIVTPYGYGGPLILQCDAKDNEELVNDFIREFSVYCKKEKIVSEFVRFHPIAENALDFKQVYNPVWDRNTLGTNLEFDDPVQSEFTKSCRKSIRQALNKGVSYRITYQPESLKAFQDVYYATMKRNEAAEYYYFDDDYFADCVKYYKDNLLLIEILLEDKVIAAGMYFLYDKTIHVHLSGTMSEYLYLSPAYVLRYVLACWGKEHGYEMIHHGGGRSNAADDSLYLFKKQFASKTQFDFYVGRKIWMPQKYSQICSDNGISEENAYFPAYRAIR